MNSGHLAISKSPLLIGVGVLAGFVDMVVFDPTGFRICEILAMIAILLESHIRALHIKKKTIALAIISIAAAISIEPSNVYWITKLVVLAILCHISLNQFLRNATYFMLGVALGYTLYSAGLIVSGNSFLAKYSAVQSAIFVLPVLFAEKASKRVASIFALAICIYVAIESNSRGQLLLLAIVSIIVLVTRLGFIKSPRSFLILNAIIIALPLASLPIKLYFLTLTVEEIRAFDSNAGDLERSILGVYAINSLPTHPRGQSRDLVETNSTVALDTGKAIDLNTSSAHNIVEDTMLFAGIPGIVLLISIYIYVLTKSRFRPFAVPRRRRDYGVVTAGTMIISFILSTSPMAGLERLEIILVINLLVTFGRGYGLANGRSRGTSP